MPQCFFWSPVKFLKLWIIWHYLISLRTVSSKWKQIVPPLVGLVVCWPRNIPFPEKWALVSLDDNIGHGKGLQSDECNSQRSFQCPLLLSLIRMKNIVDINLLVWDHNLLYWKPTFPTPKLKSPKAKIHLRVQSREWFRCEFSFWNRKRQYWEQKKNFLVFSYYVSVEG